MEFIRNKIKSTSMVMAIGVGGGGVNAVNHLYTHGNSSISYLLCNSDRQSLINSPIPDTNKILLGKEGLGAGNQSSVGKKLALESIEDIKTKLEDSGVRMAFVVAGMGGGTGTGAAPVIASMSRTLGILTVGIVTIPFESEGIPRLSQAIAGIDELSRIVDSLIIINNANIVDIYGDLSLSQAYYKSNQIISKAVKSISDIITEHLFVNVDFADICRVMSNSGVALMGTGTASGNNRALEATKIALESPLLHMQDITGSKHVLVCITSSSDSEYELKMSDVKNVPAYIQKQTKMLNATDIIWGAGYDDSLGESIQVVVIATGFNVQNIPSMRTYYGFEGAKVTKSKPEKKKSPEIKQPVNQSEKKKRPEPIRKPLEPHRIANNFIKETIELNAKNEASSEDVKVFYDLDDERPAFQRRKIDISSPKIHHKKKESLDSPKVEPKAEKTQGYTIGSLFDDL